MLDKDTKSKIDSARDILVGKVPDPTEQVNQITIALIYKFMDDMDQEAKALNGNPKFFTGEFKKFAWPKIMDKKLSGPERLDLYIQALSQIPKNDNLPPLFREIFKNAFLPYRDSETLNLFLKEINHFSYDHSENLGNAFEYLLRVLGSQGDAGQFRTPRHIIDFIVGVIDPKKDELILDPACGTGGFLISAYKHIIKHNSNKAIPNYSFTGQADSATAVQIQSNGLYRGEKLTPSEKRNLQKNIIGYDISPKMVKLSLVNMYLHKFKKPKIFEYDTLTSVDRWNDDFSVILANPPFMSPKGGIRPHNRFSIQANRSEVLFVDYIAEHLTINGRAGVIVPEGIIFKNDRAYKALRKRLVKDRLLWAVVSLPAGVFQPYSGVKTSILFLDNKKAKTTGEILFVNVENDGFDLGATRRRIDKNDLPEAFKVLKAWSEGKKSKSLLAHLVDRGKIAEGGDYNLTGSRYKMDIYTELQNLSHKVKEIIDSEDFKTGTTKIAQGIMALEKYLKNVITSQEFVRAGQTLHNIAQKIHKAIQDIDPERLKKWQIQLEQFLKQKQKWPLVELGEVCEVFIDGDWVESKDQAKIGIRLIQTGNIGICEYLDKPDKARFINKETFKRLRCTEVLPGDILISRLPDPVGRACVVPTLKTKTITAVDCTIIRLDKRKVITNFLIYLTKGKEYYDEINQYLTGSSRKRISRNNLGKIKIPLPPLEVQREVVAEIEGYQKIIDGAKQVVQNWKPTIKINPSWPMVELGEICTVVGGGTPSTSTSAYWNGKIPWITPKDLSNYPYMYISKGLKSITEKGLKESSAKIVPKDTVLLSTRAPIGYVAIAKNSLSTNQGFRSLILNSRCLPEYIYYILKSKTKLLNSLGSGATFKELSGQKIKKIKIPLPSLKEQKAIVKEIEQERVQVESCKKLIKLHEAKIHQKIISVWEQK